jgi:hypothetical protein
MDDCSSQAASETNADATHAKIASDTVAAQPISRKGKVVATCKTNSSRWVDLSTVRDVCAATIDPHSPAAALEVEGVKEPIDPTAKAISGIDAALAIRHIVKTSLTIVGSCIIKPIRKTFSKAETDMERN